MFCVRVSWYDVFMRCRKNRWSGACPTCRCESTVVVLGNECELSCVKIDRLLSKKPMMHNTLLVGLGTFYHSVISREKAITNETLLRNHLFPKNGRRVSVPLD